MRLRLKNEDGIAMAVTTWVLVLVSLLVTAFFTVALQLRETTTRDRSEKRALAAAEAGLQTAVHRLNQLHYPAALPSQCVTDRAVTLPPGTECPGQTEQLGNGASFTYYVTPELGATGPCVLLPTVTAVPTDRCVTAIGTAGGVSRRLQVRVAQQPGAIGYTQLGLIGKSLVKTWNSDELHSDVGSNVSVHFGNSTTTFADPSIGVEGAVKLLSGGSYTTSGSSHVVAGGVDTVSVPFALPPVDFEAVENANNNGALSSTYYNSATRRFQINSGDYTMPPGTYHFCKFFIDDGVKLSFSDAATTKIYIDAPSRSDSACNNAGATVEDGTFGANNSAEINKDVGQHEELLEIYLHGSGNEDTRPRYSWCTDVQFTSDFEECRSDFMLDNAVVFYGSVYAPNSSVQAHNSVEWWGAIGADKILFYNSVKFWLTDAVKDKPSGTQASAVRRSWAECQPQPTVAGDPESGCS